MKWLNVSPDRPETVVMPRTGISGSMPAIDIAALATILGTDETDILNEVLVEFLVAAKMSFEELEAAVAGGRSNEICAALHGAKGEARGTAANGLADLYADMERRATENDFVATRRDDGSVSH